MENENSNSDARGHDNDDRKPAAKRQCTKNDDMEAKKIKKEPNASIMEVNNSSEVQVLPEAPQDCPAVASLPVAGQEDEQDVEFVGATGSNPLTDFPHAREHCLVHPFHTDPTLHCINCFCYVCDKPASDCQKWNNNHCHATGAIAKWRQERHQKANPTTASASSYYRPKATVKQLLEAVTRIYPSEVAPSPPFVTQLKHYQKQSLAFMMDVEQNYQVKSGWICSDVGMGKSAIVIAAIVNNPMHLEDQPTVEEVKGARFGSEKETVLNLKCTVIFTTKSLLGQWEDEVKKHAPHLKVYRKHGKSKIRLADLADADVIVSTSCVEWSSAFTSHYKYHRIVVDESHLLGTVSARLENACALYSDLCWCVTATPMVFSISDLDRQIEFLDLENDWHSMSEENFVKKYMIRHSKSQQINGSVALALPPSTTQIKFIEMTERERKRYKEFVVERSECLMKRFRSGMLTRSVEMYWYVNLLKIMTRPDSTKIELLKKDLLELLAREPNMRAVVYSHASHQYEFACQAVESLGIETYCFDGSKSAETRDRYIREFQSLEATDPAVFLITIKAGSVGITLTAASHVYLLEPCIDPATEVQAAGRIHRLGQTKPVGVTKYVYQNTCESDILKLHEKFESGELELSSRMLSGPALKILYPWFHC